MPKVGRELDSDAVVTGYVPMSVGNPVEGEHDSGLNPNTIPL
jgi:hypothetical protein